MSHLKFFYMLICLMYREHHGKPMHPNMSSNIRALDLGQKRVCTKIDDVWQVDEDLKRSICDYLSSAPSKCMHGAYDKVPLKFDTWTTAQFNEAKLRVVPGAVVRYGAYLAPDVVLMNCFVNIGAYIDSQTMVDSFTTVGSCAQIGAKCHISAGVVIGGVLEPVNARPVVIEDGCFIGAHASVVEGVLVRRGATLAMGVHIGASTKIIDRDSGEVFLGEVPENAVVVPGTYTYAPNDRERFPPTNVCNSSNLGSLGPSTVRNNSVSIQCAVIVRYGGTTRNTKINMDLRGKHECCERVE
jgi:2,3,4,5-tetrahydropyridine-2,6-dicarboxylate N-succinyltransferase